MWSEKVGEEKGTEEVGSLLLSMHIKNIQTTVVGVWEGTTPNQWKPTATEPRNPTPGSLKGIYHKALNCYELPFVLISFAFCYCNSFTWKEGAEKSISNIAQPPSD